MIKQLYWLLAVCFTFLFSGGCNLKTSDKIDSQEVNQEIKNRKIKRVKDSEVVNIAFERGKAIKQVVMQQVGEGSPSCGRVDTQVFADALRKAIHSVEIACQMPADLHEKERQVFEAYQYNLEQQIASSENIQDLKNGFLSYTSPLTYQDKEANTKLAVLRVVLSRKELILSM